MTRTKDLFHLQRMSEPDNGASQYLRELEASEEFEITYMSEELEPTFVLFDGTIYQDNAINQIP